MIEFKYEKNDYSIMTDRNDYHFTIEMLYSRLCFISQKLSTLEYNCDQANLKAEFNEIMQFIEKPQKITPNQDKSN